MISDSERRSSFKSLRSASLVSSIFDSPQTKIHPLDPAADIELQSPGSPERRSIYDSNQIPHPHLGRSIPGRSGEVRKQPRR